MPCGGCSLRIDRPIPAMTRTVRTLLILVPALALAAVLIQCSRPSATPVVRAMYYWRTSFRLPPEERGTIDSLQVRRFYIRCFDLDWNPYEHRAEIVSPLKVLDSIPSSLEIVPVVFITNRTMIALPATGVVSLARTILERIRFLTAAVHAGTVREIQMDCDWTAQSRSNYFALLTEMKRMAAQEHLLLSATIRLHQLASPGRTGVPPVDRGMLMFYNMGDVKDLMGSNSILNVPIGEQYLAHSEHYPLPLDAALPLFQWAVVYRRGKVVHLLRDADGTAFRDTALFRQNGSDRWTVTTAHYSFGQYLYAGDIVKTEHPSPEDLRAAAASLKNYGISSTGSAVAFFDFQLDNIQRIGNENLRALYHSFE